MEISSEEGIDAVKGVLRNNVKGVSVLGSLEDNDIDGEDYLCENADEDDDEDEDENESSDGDGDLEAKLKDLKMQ